MKKFPCFYMTSIIEREPPSGAYYGVVITAWPSEARKTHQNRVKST